MKNSKLNLGYFKFRKGIQKRLIFSVFIILISMTLIIGIGLNISIKKIIEKENITRLNSQENIVKLNLSSFQESLGNDIKLLSKNDKVKNLNTTITSYMNKTGKKVSMTPSKNGGLEQQLYEFFKSYGGAS